MGVWGTGIRQDDAVCDLIDQFEDLLADGRSIEEASNELMPPGSDAENNYDDLITRLALAEMQWTYGALDPDLAAKVTADITDGRYLEPWRDDAPAKVGRRRAVLRHFAKKIQKPKGCPKKKPGRSKPAGRARFKAGDCLSVRVSDTHYAAAFVITEGQGEYGGENKVGVLTYLSESPPDLQVFEERQFRRTTDKLHRDTGLIDVSWFAREKGEQEHIEVIGNLPVRDTDPDVCITFNPWWFLGQNALAEYEALRHS